MVKISVVQRALRNERPVYPMKYYNINGEEKLNCRICGLELRNRMNYCSSCGQKFKSNDAIQSAQRIW